MRPPPRLAVAAILVIVAAPGQARAQLPQHRLQNVFPAGGRAGEGLEVQVGGTDLERVDGLWFDHPGITATRVKDLTFRVSIAPGTPIGHHDVRVLGPLGLSNPRVFDVGDRPERVENEGAPAEKNALPLNSVMNGRIGQGVDVDEFVFDGTKGRRVLLDLEGERLDGRLDGALRVVGPDGRVVGEAHDSIGLDPILDLTLPADGRYTVQVRDLTYSGSPDHVYRLTLHDGPHLDAIVPPLYKPGAPASFTLLGRNLGGEPAGLFVDGRPLERKTVTIHPPAPTEAPPSVRVDSTGGPRRGFAYRFTSDKGTSNALFVAEAIGPIVLEAEPNDEAAKAQMLTPPCEVAGSFLKPGDLDHYRFKARKGEVWWIEAVAERLGSMADPTIVLQKVPEKGPAQDLATAEDLPDTIPDFRFPTASGDAALRWQAPEDGLYQVIVHDVALSQRGDARFAYRLAIRPERPDFDVVVVTANPQQIDSLTVRAGGHALAYLVARRRDNFNGTIRVRARSLPAGVTCDAVSIGPGQVIAPLVVGAHDWAVPTAGVVDLVAEGSTGANAPTIAHDVAAASSLWPPANGPNGPMAPAVRFVRGLAVAVREPVGFGLDVKPSRWTVGQGHLLPLELTLTRRAGTVEAVQVVATDLPPNLPAPPPITIAKEATSAALPMYLPGNVPPGTYTFLLRATGPVPFNKDPNAKDRPNVNVTDPSNPVVVTVLPAPAKLTLGSPSASLPRGGSIEIAVNVARQNGYNGPLTLTLAAPASSKLTAEPVAVPANANSAKITLRAAADSPTGAVAGVAVRAVAQVAKVPVEMDEPMAVTINP
ncbi:MAG TPA: PPC domain-containing protein [Isosphaeraceae bacterium]|jgi:hypothetical protein|nr:PPC domain-containing protein [Isosphaeraceae bacterium]